MSPTMFIVVLAISIIILLALLLKLNMHPVLGIFITAVFMSFALGNSFLETADLINEGFGNTLGGIGLTIIFGSILAIGIKDTGASNSMANFFIKFFKGKNLELAPSLTAFIVSIPVFGDVTMVLTAPIASVLSLRKKVSMSTMTAFTGLGLFLTHGLVPPTPGVLAVALMLDASLGIVVFWGVIISVIAFFGTWLILRKWCGKEWIPPREDFVRDIEPAKNPDDVNDLVIREKGLPSVLKSALPLLVPVVLISLASFAEIALTEGTTMRIFLETIGERTFALFSGVVLAFILGMDKRERTTKSAIKDDDDVDEGTSLSNVLFNSWIGRGLMVAILPLLVTAMGGAFGNILQNAPVVEEIGEIVAESGFMPVAIPFFISAILMTTVGSMTMAALTSAGIVIPMLPALGISPEIATLAIGAGTLTINHVNNSGFWVMTQFFNLDTKQGLKYVTVPTFVAAIFALICLLIIGNLGLL